MYKMNEKVNNFLLTRDIFMPEMYLRQPKTTYSAYGIFTKTKERWKLKEARDSWYMYQLKLDKVCFQHDMGYWDFEDLTRWTASDKILHDKLFDIGKNPKCDGCQRDLPLMVYKFFDKKNFWWYC